MKCFIVDCHESWIYRRYSINNYSQNENQINTKRNREIKMKSKRLSLIACLLILHFPFSELAQFIRWNEVTTYASTPTTFRSFISVLSEEEIFPSITAFHLGGETKLPGDIEAVRRHFPFVQEIRPGYAGTEMQQVSSANYPINADFSKPHLLC